MAAAIHWRTLIGIANANKMLDFVRTKGCVTVPEIAAGTGFSEALVWARMNEFRASGAIQRSRPGGKTANLGNRPDIWFLPGCDPDPESIDPVEIDIEALFHGKKIVPAVQIGMKRHWLDVALFGTGSAA